MKIKALSQILRKCVESQCQRLSLLFPFVQTDRDILLLDEPLTDIDWISRKNIEAGIRRFLREPERTVVCVTHKPQWLLEERLTHYAIDGNRLEAAPVTARLRQGTHRAMAAVEPDPPGPPLLSVKIRDLYRYPRNRQFCLWPLDGLVVHEREALGVIGESGSGKSSLLRLIAGLFPPRLYRSQFAVRFSFANGDLQPIFQAPRRRRYGRLQLVLQNTTGALLPRETIRRDLDAIRRRKTKDQARFDRLVDEWGERLHLFTARDKPAFEQLRPGDLSIGMLRRYTLLRALLLFDIYDENHMRAPKVLLLDEVSRGLDEDNLSRIVEVLRHVRQRYNVALVAVSHDIDFLLQICEHFRMMFRGCVLPAHLTRANIQQHLNGDALPFLNPYYADFLDRSDTATKVSAAAQGDLEHYTGCLYRYFFHCRHEGCEGCQHETYREKEVGICG